MLILKHCLLSNLEWPSLIAVPARVWESDDLNVFAFYDCCIVSINTIDV